MKIDYISDVHLDFWCSEQNPQSPKFKRQLMKYLNELNIINTESDALIIAGDLGHYNQQDQAFLLECKNYYKHVFLVRGNHDMYLVSQSQKKKYLYASKNRYLEMKRWCADNGIIYLDGQVVSVDGYNFAGVGMSWDKSFYEYLDEEPISDKSIKEFYNNTMNDSRLILDGGDAYSVPTAYGGSFTQTTFDPFEYFASEYQKLQQINDFDNIDVMVSHYVPTNPFKYQESRYSDRHDSTFYMFDGEKDIERIAPKVWVFGHMHKYYDFIHKDVKFLCNPVGYPGENLYCEVKTIEI